MLISNCIYLDIIDRYFDLQYPIHLLPHRLLVSIRVVVFVNRMGRVAGLLGDLKRMVTLINQAGNKTAAGGTPNHRFGDSGLIADLSEKLANQARQTLYPLIHLEFRIMLSREYRENIVERTSVRCSIPVDNHFGFIN